MTPADADAVSEIVAGEGSTSFDCRLIWRAGSRHRSALLVVHGHSEVCLRYEAFGIDVYYPLSPMVLAVIVLK